MAASPYRFEPLGPHHDRASFSCGVEPLDRYFRQQVGQDQRRGLAAPYVLLDSVTSNVVGHYTLSTFALVASSLPEAVTRRLPHYDSLPAILIGRIAVDQRYRGQGFGRRLLMDALFRCRAISRQIGAMAVVVDATDDVARSFYEQYEFRRFVDYPYRLFLPITAIPSLARADDPDPS